MPKRVCQHCGHSFQIPDWLVGEEFACPSCGKSLLQPRQNREPNEKIKLVVTPPPEEIYPAARLAELSQQIITNVERVIVGKPEQVRLAVAGLFAEGHLLFEDVPGVAKTMLSRAIAQSVGCSFKRIQCTPDLQPENVIGDFILDPTTGRKACYLSGCLWLSRVSWVPAREVWFWKGGGSLSVAQAGKKL
jgi:predicted RNA-binding Zn-ribbon protein involved in translation (DUF1610 family)